MSLLKCLKASIAPKYSQVLAPALFAFEMMFFQFSNEILLRSFVCMVLSWYSTAPTNASPAPVVSTGLTWILGITTVSWFMPSSVPSFPKVIAKTALVFQIHQERSCRHTCKNSPGILLLPRVLFLPTCDDVKYG